MKILLKIIFKKVLKKCCLFYIDVCVFIMYVNVVILKFFDLL